MPHKNRAIPPVENLIRIGAADYEQYIKVGEILFEQMHTLFTQYDAVPQKDMRVLDFGCGIGRVSFPVAAAYPATVYACDVDPTAINYIQENTDIIQAIVSKYDPPLPFEDNFFDIAYANSVWTHFPKDAEAAWLQEMVRVTKPGAKLFLSVASYDTLKVHHKRGIDLSITEEVLDKEGFIFLENKAHDKTNPTKWPGVTHEYGLTRHSHGYIHNTWSQYFDIIDIVPAGSGRQDVVVLHNNKV